MPRKDVAAVRTGLPIVALAFAIALPGHAGGEGSVLLAQNALPRPNTQQRNAPAPAQAQEAPAQTQQQQQQPPAPVPQRTEIVRFENWTVTCQEFAEGTPKKTCGAQLQVQQTGTNQTLLAWTVSINDSKQFVTVMQTPTGVAIAPGIELQPEKAAKRKLAFESCEPGRCTANFTMDAAMLREITAAPSAQVVIFAVNGQTVQFSFPIKGFDKAIAHLRANL
jgi:invasion protein IalB